jgi:hypothetical protein
MNERIDELLWQAGGYTKLSYPNDTFLDGRYALTQLQLDKFAELIVRECIGKCEFVADMATVTNSGEMARKTKATADSCAAMIKEHFGVER